MVDMNAVDKVRSDLGIPKTKIAEKCKISVGTYDNWIKNPDMINASKAKALADALMITEPTQLLAIFFAPNVQTSLNE